LAITGVVVEKVALGENSRRPMHSLSCRAPYDNGTWPINRLLGQFPQSRIFGNLLGSVTTNALIVSDREIDKLDL
jgi:hypothetical protein